MPGPPNSTAFSGAGGGKGTNGTNNGAGGGKGANGTKKTHKRLIGTPCVVKSVLTEKGFGFATQSDAGKETDIYFRLERVVCNGGLPLQKGDVVKCWVDEIVDERPRATRVEVERFQANRGRRIQILELMARWQSALASEDTAAEERRRAQLHVEVCIPVWRAAADLISRAMHPQWGALRAGSNIDDEALNDPAPKEGDDIDREHVRRTRKPFVLRIAQKILDDNVELRDALNFDKKQIGASQVFFTHGDISDEFRNGGSLEKLVADLRRGRLLSSSDGRMKLSTFRLNGRIRSLNNRRLWALKRYDLELKRDMGVRSDVEVTTHEYKFCKGTAKFMCFMVRAEEDQTHPGEAIRGHGVLAMGTLNSILAEVDAKDWALEHKSITKLVAVDQLTYPGEVRSASRKHNGYSSEATLSPYWHRVATELTSKKNLSLIQEEVDAVRYNGELYITEPELGRALKVLQECDERHHMEVRVRELSLCPLTAKFVLANSSCNSGQSVTVRHAVPDEGAWSLAQIVVLVLELAIRLSSSPKAALVFRILAQSQLLGEDSAVCRAMQLERRNHVAKAYWSFVQTLAVLIPHRLGQALPALRRICQTSSSLNMSAQLVSSMMDLLTSASAALAADDGGIGVAQPWQMLRLVPCKPELRSLSILPNGRAKRCSQVLPFVRTRGRYDSVHQYLDTYFRLLREDCHYAIRASIADFRDHGNRTDGPILASKEGNAFSAQLVGCTVGKTTDGTADSRMKVVFKVRPLLQKQRWQFSASRFFMYGNLVACIVDNDFDRPVWAIVARRDLDKRIVAVDLYFAGAMGMVGRSTANALMLLEHAKSITVVASPTYFRAYEPVLRALQAINPEELPFSEELVECRISHDMTAPGEVNGAMKVSRSVVFEGRSSHDNGIQVVGSCAATAHESWKVLQMPVDIKRAGGSAGPLFSIQATYAFGSTGMTEPTTIIIKNKHWNQIAIIGEQKEVKALIAPSQTSPNSLALGDEIIIRTGPFESDELRYRVCRSKGTMQALMNDLDEFLLDPAGPLSGATTFDSSQIEALKHALQCRVSLIQGPPGTGKTFIGFRLLQMLLPTSRILVLTYKNHALDEFLQHCIRGEYTKHIVRVGGRGSADCAELEACNLKALKREFLSKDSWENNVGSDEGLQELRTHHMHARTAASAAQAKLEIALKLYSCCEEYSTDAFLAAINTAQLRDLLDHTDWNDRAWSKKVQSWMRDASWWLEDETELLPAVLSERSRWIVEVHAGYQKPARAWRDGLRSSVEYALSLWCPPKSTFKQVVQAALHLEEELRDSSDEEGDLFGNMVDDGECVKINSLDEVKMVVKSLNRSLEVQADTRIRDGCTLRRGWVLRKDAGSLNGFRLTGALDEMQSLLRRCLPATLWFDEDDEAVREFQAEIEAERLASRGGEAMSVGETRGMVALGGGRQHRSHKKSWTPSYMSNFSDHIPEGAGERLLASPRLTKLSPSDKVRLVHVHIARHRAECEAALKEALTELEETCNEEEEMDRSLSAEVLRRKKIIGMTITGASIHADMIREVRPDVVLVEEAAEVLEPQILAVMGPWVKHLIMIGDHLQLPPPVETYVLKREHHFDTSMMERLILNRLPHVSLLRQSRMLPSLSALLLPIYPKLQNNIAVVENLVAPDCVTKEVFWWNCSQFEQESERSKTNRAECERVVQLALFFIAQGFRPNQITALASYQGQSGEIRKRLRETLPGYLEQIGKKSRLEPVLVSIDLAMVGRGNRVEITDTDAQIVRGDHGGRKQRIIPLPPYKKLEAGHYVVVEQPLGVLVHGDLQKPQNAERGTLVQAKLEPAKLQQDEMVEVHTIDRYQGDENDIVIISLVRSNKEQKLGFLGSDDGRNRMCVAQSRARKGLYFIGNVDCLSRSEHWNTLIQSLEKRGCVGDRFPQRCPRHPHVICDAKEASDLAVGQTAVCGITCGASFGCGHYGHVCRRQCHPDGGHEMSMCPYLTEKVFLCSEYPQHRFKDIACGRKTELQPCPFEETVRCQRDPLHKLRRRCGTTLVDVFSRCHHPCSAILECGHNCPKACSDTCIDMNECVVPKDFACPRFPDDHPPLYGLCNTPLEEVAQHCTAQCSEILSCGHRCPRKCCQPCISSRECKDICNKPLSCGHKCTLKCSEPCQCVKPKEVICKKNSNHRIKAKCFELESVVLLRCPHPCQMNLPCGHECHRKCSECDGIHGPAFVCRQPCKKLLNCGHKCSRRCDEDCVPEGECSECLHGTTTSDKQEVVRRVVKIIQGSQGKANGGMLYQALLKDLPSELLQRVNTGKGWLKRIVAESNTIEIDSQGTYFIAGKPPQTKNEDKGKGNGKGKARKRK